MLLYSQKSKRRGPQATVSLTRGVGQQPRKSPLLGALEFSEQDWGDPHRSRPIRERRGGRYDDEAEDLREQIKAVALSLTRCRYVDLMWVGDICLNFQAIGLYFINWAFSLI